MPEPAPKSAAAALLAVALAGLVVAKTIDQFFPKLVALMPLSLLVTCLAITLLISVVLSRFK
jgi:hypothetical protein